MSLAMWIMPKKITNIIQYIMLMVTHQAKIHLIVAHLQYVISTGINLEYSKIAY
jgi:hypothetical protein